MESKQEVENQQNKKTTYYVPDKLNSINELNQTLKANRISISTNKDVTSITTYNNANDFFSTNTNPNVEKVDGYIKSNKTYVQPYIRTVKNSTKVDNFSHFGNLNPNTGTIGRENNSLFEL